MRRILFLAITSALFFIPCLAQDKSGKVQGIVVDRQEARILGTTIKFQNKLVRKVVEVNSDGEYEIELPSGSYIVTVYGPGFELYRLKSLKVAPNKVRTLNITLEAPPPSDLECPEGALCL